jgi:aspartate aminotransferase-like enzyme
MIINRSVGPVSLSTPVMTAMTQQIVSHRSKNFNLVVFRIIELLQLLFDTKQMPMLFTASGTGGLEAALVNTINKESRVLSLVTGYFGERFYNICKLFTDDVKKIEFKLGKAVDLDQLEKELKQNHYDAILITHNETATGVLNPLEKIIRVIKKNSSAFILVDAISSVGAVKIPFDELEIDVMVAAPQKALMSAPGLAILLASNRILRLERKTPSLYFNFKNMIHFMEKGSTTYTPCIPAIFALEAALEIIFQEGEEKVYQHHRDNAEFCRTELIKLGLQLYADSNFVSPTVTAVLLDDIMDPVEFKNTLEAKHNVMLSLDMDNQQSKMIRIGHMGLIPKAQMDYSIKNICECYKNLKLQYSN